MSAAEDRALIRELDELVNGPEPTIDVLNGISRKVFVGFVDQIFKPSPIFEALNRRPRRE